MTTPAEDARREAERMFPVMLSRAPVKPGPLQIPWSVAEKAYGAYAQQHGSRQTMKRMAERGGFYWGELDQLYPAWRDETSEIVKLRSDLAAERAKSEGLRKVLEEARRSMMDVVRPQWPGYSDEKIAMHCQPIVAIDAALSASPSPTLPNTRMGEDA